eukprot:6385596-Prymnesium_polylepis.1
MAKNEGSRLTGPDFEVAMTRSRLRLPHDPQTGLPYKFWGVLATVEDFGCLGAQAYAHVRFLATSSK